jgi:hypothetical protein
VVIADYEGDYYAWVEYFKGGEWKRGSMYEGVPAYAKVVYEEPSSRLVVIPAEGERGKVYYDATSFLLDINKSEALMYFALIIAAALVVIAVIHFKAKSIMRADRKVSANVRIDPNGEYDVTGDARFDDQMLDELMRIIKARKGAVDVASIEQETRYSKELVGFGIQYLSEQGLIRKKGAAQQAPQSARLLAKQREGFDAFVRRAVKGSGQRKKPKKG